MRPAASEKGAMPNSPKNEHCRRRTLENSIPCETKLQVFELALLWGKIPALRTGLEAAVHHPEIRFLGSDLNQDGACSYGTRTVRPERARSARASRPRGRSRAVG